MYTARIVFFLSIIFIVSAPNAYCHPEQSEGSKKILRAAQNDDIVLENGDIVFRRENSFWGDLSSSFAQRDGRFSHVGIVVIEDGQINVIHSYGNPEKDFSGVDKQSLQEFSANTSKLGFYRMSFSNEERGKIANQAQEYLEAKTEFDGEFSIADDAKLYCSELIWQSALKATGKDIAPVKTKYYDKKIIGIDDLFLSYYLQEIKP